MSTNLFLTDGTTRVYEFAFYTPRRNWDGKESSGVV